MSRRRPDAAGWRRVGVGVILFLCVASLASACGRLEVKGKGGSSSDPEWGIGLKL